MRKFWLNDLPIYNIPWYFVLSICVIEYFFSYINVCGYFFAFLKRKFCYWEFKEKSLKKIFLSFDLIATTLCVLIPQVGVIYKIFISFIMCESWVYIIQFLLLVLCCFYRTTVMRLFLRINNKTEREYIWNKNKKSTFAYIDYAFMPYIFYFFLLFILNTYVKKIKKKQQENIVL